MSSTFSYQLNEIEESINKTKSYNNEFIFISSFNDRYSFSTAIAYLISEKVRNILLQDASQKEYHIQNIYTKDFLDNFFNSITKKLTIQKQNLQQYIDISHELQISNLSSLFRSFILEDIYKSLEQNKLNITDEEKFSYICLNIEKVQKDKLKYIPIEILEEIISHSKFSDENHHINFLLENQDIFDQHLFESINFNELSNKSIIEFISKFKLENITGSEVHILQNLFSRIKKNLPKRININVLFVTRYGYQSID